MLLAYLGSQRLMIMDDKIQNLRRKYECFKQGKASALTVRDDARLILEEANRTNNSAILEEVGDMLMELEFSIDDDKCKCHRKHPSC